MFSPRGGQIQERLYQLVIEHLGCENPKEILDIVTGNGILALKLAMAYPHAHITGIDSWGKSWEYSRKISEENAIIAGVAGRVCFLQGDAASLRFGDGSFDAVVSNLTFHEVKAVREKGKLITEGLRVLKPGGYFVFIDLFYDERHYGKLTMLIAHLHNLGLCNFEILAIKDVISLPALMLHPKILGKAGLLYGKK
jgi:ubiquinone/menaquinone biosynthesis C-methylase UbiE